MPRPMDPPVLPLQVPPLPPASVSLLSPQLSLTFVLTANLERKPEMASVAVAVSFPYAKGSHCSIIYRWCAIFQKSNRTWITAEVPDGHVVLHMQFEDFTWKRM